jgi:hypothetical protein
VSEGIVEMGDDSVERNVADEFVDGILGEVEGTLSRSVNKISGAVILVKVETIGVSNNVTVNGKVEEGEASLEETIDVVEAVEIVGEVEIVEAAGKVVAGEVECSNGVVRDGVVGGVVSEDVATLGDEELA